MRAGVVGLVAGLLVAVLPGAARAEVDPTGGLCVIGPDGAPQPGGGPRAELVRGGPLTLAGDDGTLYEGTMTCTVQQDRSHSAPDAASATSEPGTGVAVLPPTPLDVPYQVFYLCTQVDVSGVGTRYYDDDTGGWSASADVPCASLLISEPVPIWYVLEPFGALVEDLMTSVVCPVVGCP